MAITSLCVPNWFQYKARTIIGYLNRLFLGNVCERWSTPDPDLWFTPNYHDVIMREEWYLNRIRWTADATVTDWSSIGSGFCDLPDQGDPILRFGRFQEEDLYVFRGRSVWHVTPSLDPYSVIKYEGPISTNGIWSPNSLQTVRATPTSFDARYRLAAEASFIYLGRDDFYRLDAAGGESIGKAIREEFFKVVDPSQLCYAWSFQDTPARKYYLITRLTARDENDYPLQMAWIYDWEEKTWSHQDWGPRPILPSTSESGWRTREYSTVFNCPPLTALAPLVGGTNYALHLWDVGTPYYESIAGRKNP